MTPDMMVTSSERRIEHRSILQWGFTLHIQNSGRLGREVGFGKQTYFTPLSLNEYDGYRLRTSITCHKCGSRGYRPKQSFFLCHTCGYRDNADKNAATNIAMRLVRLIPSLRSEKGLGTWLPPIRKNSPKTPRTRSKRRSLASKKSLASPVGSTVADCYDQTSLEEFASSADPATATTVEKPSVAGKCGSLGKTKQWTEAQSRERSDAPMISSKGHVTDTESNSNLAGDSGHGKSGTQKSEVKEASSLCNVSCMSEGIRSGTQMIGFPRNIMEDVDEQVGSRNKV